jgi:uncharacterized protein (TIGR03437 family)
VTFTTGTYSLGSATLNSSGVASLTLSGVQLSAGANSITAQYNGDNSYYGASANATVTITSASNGPPSIASISNSASYTAAFAAGDIISVFGSQLAPATAGALSVPLPTSLAGTSVTIDDIPAPLYYVSAGQLNIQIPYGIPANTTVQLRVNNNGESAFDSFAVSAAEPAIFTTNSGGTGQGAILNTSYQLVDASNPASPGNTYIQIYCIGLGAVSNQPASGAASPSGTLAYTSGDTTVKIGNVSANVSFSGLAPGYVGLYQVNALVPASVTAGGAVPVVVSIGGVSSNTATIAVGSN